MLLDRYDGDLRNLREEADGDPDDACRRLTMFAGIGRMGGAVFPREVQAVWTEYAPFADDRTLEGAAALELPDSAVG